MSELAITELRTEIATLKKRLDALEAPTHLPTLPGGGPAPARGPLPHGAMGIDWNQVGEKWKGLNVHHEKAKEAYVRHVQVLGQPPTMDDLESIVTKCLENKVKRIGRDELAAKFNYSPPKANAMIWFLQKAQLAVYENHKIRFIE